MRMEIPPTPPTTPPAMAPVCELPPLIAPAGVESEEPLVADGKELELELELELEAEVKGNGGTGVDETGPEAPDGLSTVPGSSSGLSIRSKTRVRSQSGERGRWERREILTTNGLRIVWVPIVPRLGRVVSVSRQESFSNEL
jgi:hypothetical protein